MYPDTKTTPNTLHIRKKSFSILCRFGTQRPSFKVDNLVMNLNTEAWFLFLNRCHSLKSFKRMCHHSSSGAFEKYKNIKNKISRREKIKIKTRLDCFESDNCSYIENQVNGCCWMLDWRFSLQGSKERSELCEWLLQFIFVDFSVNSQSRFR